MQILPWIDTVPVAAVFQECVQIKQLPDIQILGPLVLELQADKRNIEKNQTDQNFQYKKYKKQSNKSAECLSHSKTNTHKWDLLCCSSEMTPSRMLSIFNVTELLCFITAILKIIQVILCLFDNYGNYIFSVTFITNHILLYLFIYALVQYVKSCSYSLFFLNLNAN